VIGLKIERSHILGLGLCVLLTTTPASAKQQQSPIVDEDLKQAYSLLFSKSSQILQQTKWSKWKNNTKLISNARQRVIWKAKKQLQRKYRWGGTSPRTGFDCSGLMQYAFKSIKVDIPRTAKAQYKYSKRIPLSKLQAGDLIFFHTRRTRARVNHVGLYLGKGEFIHAPRRGKRVSIAKLNKYWHRKAVGAGRI